MIYKKLMDINRSIFLQMVMKLLPWIDVDKLDWIGLSSNPNAIELLINNLDKIKWDWLSENLNTIDLLKYIGPGYLKPPPSLNRLLRLYIKRNSLRQYFIQYGLLDIYTN